MEMKLFIFDKFFCFINTSLVLKFDFNFNIIIMVIIPFAECILLKDHYSRNLYKASSKIYAYYLHTF